MNRAKTVLFLFIGWVLLIVVSVVAARLTEPTGELYTRGLNRVGVFLGWELAAVIVAIATFFVGLRQFVDQRLYYWLSRIPILIHGTLVVGIIILLVYMNF